MSAFKHEYIISALVLLLSCASIPKQNCTSSVCSDLKRNDLRGDVKHIIESVEFIGESNSGIIPYKYQISYFNRVGNTERLIFLDTLQDTIGIQNYIYDSLNHSAVVKSITPGNSAFVYKNIHFDSNNCLILNTDVYSKRGKIVYWSKYKYENKQYMIESYDNNDLLINRNIYYVSKDCSTAGYRYENRTEAREYAYANNIKGDPTCVCTKDGKDTIATYSYIYDDHNNWIEKTETLLGKKYKRYNREITYW